MTGPTTGPSTPLSPDVLVVQLADGIAGSYCTKLFADAGATVIRVEDVGGDPLRRRSASGSTLGTAMDGLLFTFLAAGSSSIVVDPDLPQDTARLWQLLAAADIVVWAPGSLVAAAAALSPEQIRRRAPRAVVVTLTPFGLVGLAEGRPANEFTMQAMSGGAVGRGQHDRAPLSVGGEHGEWVLGVFGAVGGLAAWQRAERDGVGELVDVAMLDALHLTQTMFAPTFFAAAGRPSRLVRTRTIPLIHPTSDGYVGFQITTGQQWLDFCVMVERPDWGADTTLNRHDTRVVRHDELNEFIDGWTLSRTSDEIVELASALRLPVAPVNNGETLPMFEQAMARGWYVRNPGGAFLQPVPPYTFAPGVAPRAPEVAPALGSGSSSVTERPAKPVVPTPAGDPALPFDGLRIADFTAFWAGPIIGHLFAILGADVIHVESTKRPDGLRAATLRHDMSEGWWDASPAFAATNTNKRGLTLDMSTERGRDLAKALVQASDVLIENFSSRVLEHWGMTYEVLSAGHPELIMVRAPGFGSTGPWRDHVAYATTVEQASGVSWATGFADDRPEVAGGACDPIAGTHAAFAIMLALESRRRTGRGTLLEVPQFTTGINLAAEQVIEHSASGVLLGRDGNRSWTLAPQGAYRVADAERTVPGAPADDWIALSVEDEEQWAGLCRTIGATELLSDAELSTAGGRRRRHDEIDKEIERWARSLRGDDAVAALLAAGVPASVWMPMYGLEDLPEVRRRGLYELLDHPVLGPIPVVGYPARFERGPTVIHRRVAPGLGEHNHEILRDLLGLSDKEIEALEADGVIGTRAATASAW